MGRAQESGEQLLQETVEHRDGCGPSRPADDQLADIEELLGVSMPKR
jgi:hypothetical protein